MATPVFHVVYVLLICGLCCQIATAVRYQCQQCERVLKPEDCLRRINCAEDEICFTERYVTQQGHVFYDLGCKLKDTCVASNYFVSKAMLEQRQNKTATASIGKRQDLGGPMAAHVCEECCDFDHCNDLLCGGHESRGVKCLNCADMQDMANCEDIRACPGHQMCFVEERVTDQFELLFSSGCMREIQCQAFVAAKAQSGGQFDPCFKCCNETFCNVECVNGGTTTQAPTPPMTTKAPATTKKPMPPNTSASTTAMPPTTRETTTPTTVAGPTMKPVTAAPKTTAAPPMPTSRGTPPPVVGRRGFNN